METYFPNTHTVDRRWHVLNAGGQPLGRLATQVVYLLQGKGKPLYAKQLDFGDFVVVVNASQVVLTGKKREQKSAFHHTKFPGGVRLIPMDRLLSEKPEEAVIRAVKGMLPKNKLRARMLTRLRVYRGAEHPHGLQTATLVQGKAA